MIRLDAKEIAELTGYVRPYDQCAELHRLGFARARLNRFNEVVLERAHYDAVCDGRFAQHSAPRDTDRPKVARVR